MAVELYSRETMDQIHWPDTPTGRLGRDYLLPILDRGVRYYIGNADKELQVLKVNGHIVPLTVSNAVDGGATISSPFSHYLCMLPEELGDMPLLLKMAFIVLFHALRPVFTILEFNKVVMVNNWLFSTTFYPDLTAEDIREVNDFLVRKFPRHAIVWTTVYEEDIQGATIKDIGGILVFHRTIHIWNPFQPGFRLSSDFKKDCKMLDKMDYALIDGSQLDATDVKRMHELYHKLYIEKHSLYNAHYTEKYFQDLITSGELEIRALKKNGRVDGFFVAHSNNYFITGFIGYDLTIPQTVGLYRILVASFLLLSKERGLIANVSAGVGRFKKNRGCYVEMEYIGVYIKHLRWWRGIPWKILEAFNPLVRKLIAKYDT